MARGPIIGGRPGAAPAAAVQPPRGRAYEARPALGADPRAAPPAQAVPDAASFPRTSAAARAVVVLFLISLIIPMYFHVGAIRLSPYRLFLLALFIPLFVMWLSGAAGRIRAPDLLVLAFALWGALTFHLSDSGATIQTMGVWVLETMGAYLIGRVMIRDSVAFGTFARTFVWMVVLVAPLALFESVTNRNLVVEMFRVFGPVFSDINYGPRLGLKRAQGPFEHPILFGVFCAAAFSFAWLLASRSAGLLQPILRGFGVVVGTFFSLSTGAYVSLAVQGAAIGWDRAAGFLRRKWNVLAGIFAACYIVIDMISNRTPFLVFIQYLTLNHGTAYWRVHIWTYGTQSVWKHPVLGIGLGNWERPDWMFTSSIDNFWLVMAVRHGLPGFLFIALATALVFRLVGRAEVVGPVAAAQRKALLITLFGLCVAICTVHLWGATFALFMFLLGSGMWLAEPGLRDGSSSAKGAGEPAGGLS